MILLLRYQNLSASNVAFVITVETLPALIKIILFKAKANNNVIIPTRLISQLFFLTIAMKNKTKMARVIEADKISPIGGSSKMPMVSSKASKISCIAKRENAIAANIIFLRPVLLYAKIDSTSKRRENIPIAA